ncbi:hypothetical protein Rhe02_36450 [Rhizocola hellebori]|uniref:MurR/RpiR family transcriptional regulator n=1 Tax=Rhizocola hellebori TaxID=1392758 RepID=A0A8J3VH60_9ACTN|nr:GntR family transcriptional regulator [Rhizocola hellebori]GIH05578.1 hypothetical protein Rhe02_36450 [Rhizocola hellebori]
MKQNTGSELAPASLSMPPRESLAARSAAALKRYLLAEGLEPGDKLPPERRLAEALNVSRTVLREAVNQLVGEGLVRREPSRSPTVTDFDRAALAHLLDEPEPEPGSGASQTPQGIRAHGIGAGNQTLSEQRGQQRDDLESLYTSVNTLQLNRICDALERARRVVVFGDGAAASLSGVLARLLRHVGVRAEVLPSGPVERVLDMHGLGPGDVVIGITLWLPFRGSVDVMRLAGEAGCHTVALTASADSPITRHSSEVAIVPAQGGVLPFSVLPTIALFENLASALAVRRPQLVAEVQRALHDQYVREGYLR